MIGYYDANKDSMDCDIDFHEPDKFDTICRIGCFIFIGIPLLLILIGCILEGPGFILELIFDQ